MPALRDDRDDQPEPGGGREGQEGPRCPRKHKHGRDNERRKEASFSEQATSAVQLQLLASETCILCTISQLYSTGTYVVTAMLTYMYLYESVLVASVLQKLILAGHRWWQLGKVYWKRHAIELAQARHLIVIHTWTLHLFDLKVYGAKSLSYHYGGH